MMFGSLTSADNYFEDFKPGDAMRHMRGKTVGELENVMFTHLTMNTAQGHFNEDEMSRSSFGSRIVFGGITASIVIGLASQDTSENAIAELEMKKLRLKTPVFHGDTLYASSTVLAVQEPDVDAEGGRVEFQHTGFNQRGEVVCEIERSVLVRRRPKGTA